ncbi:type I-E CRISPR-associated endoribonuclease Cas2e [Evtepia sp.]|uniref:type I-E CRISPR-associated endoribonuclease Cas2e n=1 Tax=Evtepia sp. TaxID=2773933 RepID=UPI00399067CD
MTVIAMDAAPEGVRGELTRWFLELKPGVFIGKVNTRIRDLLWERICQTDAANGAVMAYAAPNEQGFSLRVFGVPKRRVNDFEGIQLITIQKD